jgi:hypothetical protein
MSTITRAKFGFAEIVKLRAKVIDKVEYKNVFFLVKEALKILLN